MRVLLTLLPAFLLLACGAPDAPSEAAPPAAADTITPPPGAYDDDPLAAPPPQEPLPEGLEARPPAQPSPSPTATTPAETPASEGAPTAAIEAPRGVLTVTEIVLAKSIVDRAPQGVSHTFPDGAEVNCYTRLDNPSGGLRTIRHQYFHGDELKRSLELEVKGTTWRTWSNKRAYGPGAWRVDVVDEAGLVLATEPFVVR